MRAQSTLFWRAFAVFLLVALSLAIWSQARNGKVQSDIFSILRDSAASEDAALQRELMDRQGRILALMIEGPDAAEAAEEVARRLVSSGAVSGACVPGPEALAQAGKTVFDNRMTLLFPSFLAAERRTYDQEKPAERFDAWLARRSADRLDAFLQSPRSLALAGSVPEDPLLLSASFIDAIPEGFAGPGARVMAEISGPATDSAVQKAVLGSLSELKSELAAKGLVLHASGAVLFAQRSEVFIRADVTRLNVLMTLALGAILLAALRSIRSVLAAALPVVMGALAAAAALFLFEDGVYALALGIGGILGGIAIDYPLHILLHRHLEEPGYGPAARRLVRPLFLGCATTALAFLFLLFSDLPLMRQVGFLVGVGLFAVMLFVLPAFAAFAPKGDPEATAARLEAFSLPQTPVLRWGFVALLALLCAFAPGLRHGNDLDALQPPMPDLLRENDIVRGSGADASRLFVTFGSDLAGALAASPGPGTGDLSSPLSTSGETLAAAQWVQSGGGDFERLFRAELDARGYDTGAFAPLLAGFPEPAAAPEACRSALRQLAASLPPGLSWMMAQTRGGAWIVTRAPDAYAPGGRTQPLDVRAGLESAFRLYRADALTLTALGFIAASLIIVVVMGLRRGLKVVAIPALSSGAALGCMALLGEGFGLFQSVGLLLGYGLSMDYALFTLAPGTGRASIRLSAMTTLSAFAILATSGIPAVRGLGLTVLFIIVFTLVQCELHPVDSGHAGTSAR